MIWQPPTLKLFTLSSDKPTTQVSGQAGATQSFTATGTGFDERTSQVLFVRADITDGSLKAFQVIPCCNLKVNDVNNMQEITFDASLFERDIGPYHLVAWNPADGGVNQATVLEWAMAVRADPAVSAVVTK